MCLCFPVCECPLLFSHSLPADLSLILSLPSGWVASLFILFVTDLFFHFPLGRMWVPPFCPIHCLLTSLSLCVSTQWVSDLLVCPVYCLLTFFLLSLPGCECHLFFCLLLPADLSFSVSASQDVSAITFFHPVHCSLTFLALSLFTRMWVPPFILFIACWSLSVSAHQYASVTSCSSHLPTADLSHSVSFTRL